MMLTAMRVSNMLKEKSGWNNPENKNTAEALLLTSVTIRMRLTLLMWLQRMANLMLNGI